MIVQVTDTGCGISPDFKPYVFDRFRQLDSSSKRTHGGLGIGLAIVRHIVELHGGSVTCESAGPDRGATFTLRLPIRAEESAPIAVAPEVRQAGAMRPSSDEMVDLTGIKVLLVDDEPDARELLTEVLQQCGAIVVATHSADEAMRLIPRERPAVLLSDIGLPGEDGYKLISRVRALPPERRRQAARRRDHRVRALRRRDAGAGRRVPAARAEADPADDAGGAGRRPRQHAVVLMAGTRRVNRRATAAASDRTGGRVMRPRFRRKSRTTCVACKTS